MTHGWPQNHTFAAKIITDLIPYPTNGVEISKPVSLGFKNNVSVIC